VKTPTEAKPPRVFLAAGLAAAFGASACCFGPLALAALGASGAWLASMRALEPLQPVLIAATLAALGGAFHRLYVVPRGCAPDEACATDKVLTRQRTAFWLVGIAAAAMLAFPLYVPWLA
jgi:mercuric ion transport protein